MHRVAPGPSGRRSGQRDADGASRTRSTRPTHEENSYDCEDDAIFGSGADGDSIGEACAKLAGSAMRSRERYGSGLSWVPDKGWPEEIDRAR
jgi:hypothetical protein